MESVGPQRWNIPGRFRIGWFIQIGATSVSHDSAPEKNLTARQMKGGNDLTLTHFFLPVSHVLVGAAADQILHGEQQKQTATPVQGQFRIFTISNGTLAGTGLAWRRAEQWWPDHLPPCLSSGGS